MSDTYRVEIVEIKTGKVVSVIGKNMSKEKAEKRIETGLMRCDTNNYFVRDVKEAE